MDTKVCRYCHQEKALQDFILWHDAQGNIRYRNTCRRCKSLMNQKLLIPLSAAPLPQGMKRCPKCKALFPLEEFVPSPTKKHPDRRQHQCRKCTKLFWHARYIRLREQYLAKEKAARAKDPDTYRARQRIRLNTQYQNDAAFRHRVLESNARNRIRRRSLPYIEPVSIDVLYARDKGICGLCHMPVARKDASRDHIIPAADGGEYSYRNMQLAHTWCNSRKGKYRNMASQLRMF